MAAGRRFRLRQRLPGRPVHAARLAVLDPVRHERHVGRARLGSGPLPDRLRHRGGTRRARRPRCRGQRGVPRRDAGSSVPARRHERSSQRARDPITPATARSPRSAIQTATAGCSRRSRRGFPDEDSALDVATLTELLREAEQHHGEYEPTAPKHHWSAWYAAYIVARERGRTPEEAAKDGALHMDSARR